MINASGNFHVESWNETTYDEDNSGRKMTRASVTQTFAGAIEGRGSVEYLMCNLPDAGTRVVGMQLIDGRIGERSGTFALETTATFDGKEVKGVWSVIAGSGTGQFDGLRGDGTFQAPLGSDATWTLDCEIG
jgi:hypothetical protein